jgi:hypothetical protein
VVVESAEMGLKTVIKVCRQEEKNKFGSLKLVLLIKITFHVNRKFLILVFRLLTGLSTIFWHLSTGLSTQTTDCTDSHRLLFFGTEYTECTEYHGFYF